MSGMEILTFLNFKIVNFLFYYRLRIKKAVENSGHKKKQVSSKSRGQLHYRL